MAEQENIIDTGPSKLTTWKNEPTWSDLHKDYEGALEDHNIFLEKLEGWRLSRDGGPAVKAGKTKSKIRPRTIRKQSELTYAALEEPLLNSNDMYKIKGRESSDKQGAELNKTMINYQWSTVIDRVGFVNDLSRSITDDGTVVVKTGWEVEEKVRKVTKMQPIYASPEQSFELIQRAVSEGKMSEEQANQLIQEGKPMQVGEEEIEVEETYLHKNNPTYDVCDVENVIFDPTCKGRAELAQFIIHEYDIDWSELKMNEYKEEEIEDEDGNIYKETSGIYKNLKYINTETDDYPEDDHDYVKPYMVGQNFKFNDKARKKLRAYEYWGFWDINGDDEKVTIVATWIGKTLIRLEEQPFVFDELPFDSTSYMPKKGDIHGEPDAELFKDNQDAIGNYKRAVQDMVSEQAIGQEFIDEQFFAGPLEENNYKEKRTVKFRHGMNPKEAIHKTKIEPISPTVLNLIDRENAEIETYTGSLTFNRAKGGENSLQAGDTRVRSSMESSTKREMGVLRRISNLMVNIGRKTVMMNQAYLSEEEVVRVTNKEYVKIKREDLQGEYDLTVEISTPEKDNEMAAKLIMLMQTNQANMDQELAKMIYVQITELWKLFGLSGEIKQYEPKPDPAQQKIQELQIQQLELGNKKIRMEMLEIAKKLESEDSKIKERETRGVENINADVKLKRAKALLAEAEAEKVQSEIDVIDQEFLNEYDEPLTKQERHERDKEFDAMSKAEQEAIKQQGKKDNNSNAKAGSANNTDDKIDKYINLNI